MIATRIPLPAIQDGVKSAEAKDKDGRIGIFTEDLGKGGGTISWYYF